jgi:hypothetical protein
MAVEWCKSMSTEVTMGKLVTAEVMAKAAIGRWWTSDGKSYPNPCPSEIVVFEDFYWHGFGNPCHPFLHICSLHPNSVLSVSIFITLYESFLGIQPHFNLWRHFF